MRRTGLAIGATIAFGLVSAGPVAAGSSPPSVAVSGKVCIDEGRDGACDNDDPPVYAEDVRLIGPDGQGVIDVNGVLVGPAFTGDAGDGFEFDRLPILPEGERYRVVYENPGGGRGLATAGGVPVSDPTIGIAVARELVNDGDRDDTLDFTLVRVGPFIRITYPEGAERELVADAPTPLTFSVNNAGSEPLLDVRIVAVTREGPDLEQLSCDFSGLGGPASGTDWVGPFAVGDHFECSAIVPAMPVGGVHIHSNLPTATGADSGQPAWDIGDPDWLGEVLPPPSSTSEVPSTSAPPTSTSPVPSTSAPPTSTSPAPDELPATGGGALLPLLGAGSLVVGSTLLLACRRVAASAPPGDGL
jgi:hypothetical protein